MTLRMGALRGVAAMLFVPFGCALAIEACGGDDATIGEGAVDASTDAATNGDSPSAIQDTGSPLDSASPRDAGTDSASSLDPTPGTIACGTATCDAPAQYCCFASDGGASCLDKTDNSCGANGGVPFRCEEAADCDAGLICCQQGFNGPLKIPDNVCAHDCPRQVCRTNAECGTSTSCNPQPTCHGSDLALCGDASLNCN